GLRSDGGAGPRLHRPMVAGARSENHRRDRSGHAARRRGHPVRQPESGAGMTRPLCLITPPSGFLLDERMFMTLGILKVAASLEQAGHPVELLDLSGVSNYETAVRDHAVRSAADWFGITATTPQMPAATIIAGELKRVRPSAQVVLGGPHITLVNASR